MASNPGPIPHDDIRNAAGELARKTDSDVYLFNSDIERPFDQELIDSVCDIKRRKNIYLILVTEGGDPDAAYRMARCMQGKYERFTCIVPGFCKSAGTLLAVGAHELVMTDSGELGPIDVQMAKKDELGEWQSGLTIAAAMRALHERSFSAFEHFFLTTKKRSLNRVTFKTATEIAAKLTGALFAPIFQQIDPLSVGEASRSTAIATYYGVRLDLTSDNLKANALDYLVSKYPHHGFVIDCKEAEDLFQRVRGTNQAEAKLIAALGDAAKHPAEEPYSQREFLSDPEEDEHDTGEAKAAVSEKPTDATPAPAGERIQHDGHRIPITETGQEAQS